MPAPSSNLHSAPQSLQKSCLIVPICDRYKREGHLCAPTKDLPSHDSTTDGAKFYLFKSQTQIEDHI